MIASLPQCGYESAREDHFLDIPLVIKPFGSQRAYGSVEEALHGFTQPETLEEDNQYFCEQCSAKQDAHKVCVCVCVCICACVPTCTCVYVP